MAHPNSVITSIIQGLNVLQCITVPPSRYGDPQRRSKLSKLSIEESAKAQKIMQTLHFLFPHDLLPALDLLDRKVVTHMYTEQNHGLPSCQQDESQHQQNLSEIFYIQSASAVTSNLNKSTRFRKAFNPSDAHYEVRLDAWNCSCPAFAYSALGQVSEENENEADPSEEIGHLISDEADVTSAEDLYSWKFAGRLTRSQSGAPVCKHILAATFAKAAPNLFGDGVNVEHITNTQAAGWGGGWGD